MQIHPTLMSLLREALTRDASDLHVMAGISPGLRIDGDIEFMAHEPLPAGDLRPMLLSLLSDEQQARLEVARDISFSITIPALGRFRVALYYQRGHLEAAVRIVPPQVRRLEDMGLPPVVQELSARNSGLVLVTGPTGAGKTTLMNALVDAINSERRARIVTIEDPIEFVHTNKRSVVIQREVESDTPSFQSALHAALRQDPNVICVGELRSLETVATALTAAETGHLVLATLHTQGAWQTIERVVDVFPTSQHNQIRAQLANCLQGVISLHLLPRLGEPGRVLAYEILMGTGSIKNLIRGGKLEQLPQFMQTGGEDGMNTMDRCLRQFYEQGIISYDTALSRAQNPGEFRSLRTSALVRG